MSRSGRRVTVLLSGSGRSLANLLARQRGGVLDCELVRVISSRRDVRGLHVAERAGLSTTLVERRAYGSPDDFGAALTAAIEIDEPDLVVMAGFLCLYPLPERLLGRVINIHPSLLPLFGGKGYYGRKVHEAVLAAGQRVSGCTVHFVDDRYDHGPAIIQLACPVLPDDGPDQLAARVFARECEALPRAVALVLDGQVRYADGKASFAPGIDRALFC